MRGDDAVALAVSIRDLQSRLSENTDLRIASAMQRLAVIAEIIEREVIVR
jgi:hypothetical protein